MAFDEPWLERNDGQRGLNGLVSSSQIFVLEPPAQLYAGGTYRDVCECLLKTEKQKKEALDEVAARRRHEPMVACGMRIMPQRPPKHPQPLADVALSPSTKSRIAENAKALESFLKSLDYSLAQIEQVGWSESSLIRYRMFLHLKRTHPGIWLVPTVDIEFVWLAHIFRTQTYWKDMKTLGVDLQHSLCLQGFGEVATFADAVCATASLWNDTFGPMYPYLPPGTDTSIQIFKVGRNSILEGSTMRQEKPYSFFPGMGATTVTESPATLQLPPVSLQPQDVAADLKWFPELQQAFRDLSSNRYYSYAYGRRNGEFIEKQVIPSYERFLDLCRRSNMENPAPPYVLDLVWHAHQIEPVCYKNDCLSLFGCEFWHDPWPTGRGKSTPLSAEFQCQWKQAFGTRIGEDWEFYLDGN